MRQYSGTDKRDPDAINKIDYFLHDISAAMARLTKGQLPIGSGGTPGSPGISNHHLLSDLATYDDHPQYLYLAGRSGGQTVFNITDPESILRLSGSALYTGKFLELLISGYSLGYFGMYPTSNDLMLQASQSLQISVANVMALRASTAPTASFLFTPSAGSGANFQTLGCYHDHEVADNGYANFIIRGQAGSANCLAEVQRVNDSTPGNLMQFSKYIGGVHTIMSYVDKDGAFVHPGGVVGAPADATYILQSANATLASAQVLGNLGTGLVKNTTTAGIGVLSIAAGGDLPNHTHAAGQGGNVPVENVTNAMTTDTAQSVTGKKTFDEGCLAMLDAVGNSITFHSADTGGIVSMYFPAAAGNIELAATNKAQSWSGVQSFPDNKFLIVGSATATKKVAFEVDGVSVGTRTLTVQDANGTIALTSQLGTIASQAANNVSITGGSITGITDLAVADGGTGASTLAGAGIVTVVGTPYNGIGLDLPIDQTTLLASAPGGFYRMNMYIKVTTAVPGAMMAGVAVFNDGVAQFWYLPFADNTGVFGNNIIAITDNSAYLASLIFYSAMAQDIAFYTEMDGGQPTFTCRVRLEYLGA